MKTKALLVLSCVLPLAVIAAPAGILIKADTVQREAHRMVATGTASAILQGGDLRVTADEITGNSENHLLRFSGNVTIHSGKSIVKAKELTLDLQDTRVFVLSNGNMVTSSGPYVEDTRDKPGTFIFATPFPNTETTLPRSIPKP